VLVPGSLSSGKSSVIAEMIRVLTPLGYTVTTSRDVMDGCAVASIHEHHPD
jgi:hypothetical protein